MTAIPADLADFLSRLDEFIEREIKPLEEEHIEFFDHRREWRRTDWENGGVHSGEPGDAVGITAFIVETSDPGYEIPYFHWTFNMSSDHAEVVLSDLRVPHSAIL